MEEVLSKTFPGTISRMSASAVFLLSQFSNGRSAQTKRQRGNSAKPDRYEYPEFINEDSAKKMNHYGCIPDACLAEAGNWAS